jgi:hypothetical protein
MMLESGRFRLIRPSAVIITHKQKSECPAKLPIEPRDNFGPYDFQK